MMVNLVNLSVTPTRVAYGREDVRGGNAATRPSLFRSTEERCGPESLFLVLSIDASHAGFTTET